MALAKMFSIVSIVALACLLSLTISLSGQTEPAPEDCSLTIWRNDSLALLVYTSELCPCLGEMIWTPSFLVVLDRPTWPRILYAETEFAYTIKIDTVEITGDSIPEFIVAYEDEQFGDARLFRLRQTSIGDPELQWTDIWQEDIVAMESENSARFVRTSDTSIVLGWTVDHTSVCYFRSRDTVLVIRGE